MTNSGLIVFLPLVGAILGGIVGAVGGAWANSWYRDREAKKAEIRERNGLLLLIHAELHHNLHLLMALGDEPDEARLAGFTNFQAEAWTSSRVRLTQLLPKDHIAALATYYSKWQSMTDLLNDPSIPLPEKLIEVVGYAELLQKYSDTAMRLGTTYIFDDPNFEPTHHDAFIRDDVGRVSAEDLD